MDARSSASTESSDRELLITRIFDAPRSLVFKAWSDPEHLARWWGPSGFTLPVCKMDFRPGGAYRYCMRSPSGIDSWIQGVYREIVEPERIVLTGSWTDAKGNPTRPATMTTITFEEHDGKTKLTLHNGVFESVAARDEHRGGWSSSLERLAEYLATA
jgi:uncharacterized protein YndB with AHSA1/START domain